MSLWGKSDAVAITGTVRLITGSTAVAANTATDLSVVSAGDNIFLSSANTSPGQNTRYKVAASTTTTITLESAYAGANSGTAAISYQTTPKSLPEDYAGDSLANVRNTVGVDVTEAGVTANRAKGLKTPGWHNYVAGTGGRAGRKNVETLVAMRSMTNAVAGDANDDDTAADS